MTNREQLLLAYANAQSAMQALSSTVDRLDAFAAAINQPNDPRLLAARKAHKDTVQLVGLIDGALKWLGE